MSAINVDVLSQIFDTAINADLSSLFILRSVNCQWFKTVENLPKLWSRLKLYRKIHFIDPAYVCLHIQNSSRLPLDIDISLPEDVSYNSDLPSICELRKVVYKIKSLTIGGSVFEVWQTLVSRIGQGQPAPLLERLVLKTHLDTDVEEDRIYGMDFTTLSTALTPSPKLVHLQLPASPLPTQLPPQLANITSLTFDTPVSLISPIELFEIIRAVPKLQHFTFKIHDYSEWYNFRDKVTVPQLRSAHVSVPGCGLEILIGLHAPLLTDVRMDGSRGGIDAVYDVGYGGYDKMTIHIFVYLSAHSPNLRRLDLISICFEPPKEDFKYILSSNTFPTLEELTLKRANIPDASLIESAVGRSSLRKLELHDCRHISIHGLQTFIQGRTDPEFVLVVEDCPGLSDEDINSLAKMVSVERIGIE